MSVSNKEFDELVESTTKYLQNLLDRVGALEDEVKALKAKPAPAPKTTGTKQ